MRFFPMIALLFLQPAFGQSITVFNASSVADIIDKHSAKYKSFSGRFVYKKNNRTQSGTITYAAPDKLVMQFGTANNPQNQKIISDSRFLWIIDGDIIGRQSLETVTNPLGAWNIKRLITQYTPTAPNTGLEIMYGSTPAYKIVLEPKKNTTSFRRIELIAEKSGLIRQITGISRVGIKTELSISYNEFNQEYDQKLFLVETTEDSQIYDNIFN